MWVKSIKIKNKRSFKGRHFIEFSKGINVLIGPNNSGKSTIISSIQLLQNKTLGPHDLRLGAEQVDVILSFHDLDKYVPQADGFWVTHEKSVFFAYPGSLQHFLTIESQQVTADRFKNLSSEEPHNLIYPFLSKRKVTGYNETVNLKSSNTVTGNFENLYAKIDRISNSSLPAYDDYKTACLETLGFFVSTTASDGGKKAVLMVNNFEHISIDTMGEGVANLLGLIVDLCVAENKIFLIEEPENDIHPQALKALLKLIEKKSINNQFIISTHSNIVVKQLCGIEDTKLFKVSMELKERMPHSTVIEVGNDPMQRQQVLEELGYEFDDFSMWKAWLFLEEASAEGIIREILIPLFVPLLSGKLRTFSAKSVSEVEPKFNDFNKLFVFLHLQQTYKNKVWVIVDGGKAEKVIIDKMKADYQKSGWNEDNFQQFSEHDFERYYPETFKAEVDRILNLSKKEKQEAKLSLNKRVKEWAEQNPVQAKAEFKVSAKEVIDILKKISKEVSGDK